MTQYLVRDPENCAEEFFNDLTAAIHFANESIEGYIDDEWNTDAVEQITISKVIYQAQKHNTKKKVNHRLDEDGVDETGMQWGEWDEYCEYKMDATGDENMFGYL